MQVVKFRYHTQLHGKPYSRKPLEKTVFALDTSPTPDPVQMIEHWNADPDIRATGFTYHLVDADTSTV